MTADAMEPGTRVRHKFADLTGTVVRGGTDYIRVRWDHYGLAVAALGTMADLQKAEMLVPTDEQVPA